MLSSVGAVTITGGAGVETVTNAGTITGSVDMGAGNDRFVEGAGSSVMGGVDGGAGDDLYTVLLAGNRSGIGQRSNFERLSVEGNGTLGLTLDQGFQSIALAGTGLNLALGGFTVGAVTGSDAAETLAVDGDIAMISLGAGNDELALGTTRASGLYMGGAGSDLLRFAANAPVTLAGTATGFERVALAGGALTVAGTLGTTGTALAFGDGAQSVTVAAGARSPARSISGRAMTASASRQAARFSAPSRVGPGPTPQRSSWRATARSAPTCCATSRS